MADVSATLEEMEAGIERLTNSSKSWPRDQKPPAEDEQRITSFQDKLKSTGAQISARMAHAQGLELKELRAVAGRVAKSQEGLDRVHAAVADIRQAMSAQIVSEASAA